MISGVRYKKEELEKDPSLLVFNLQFFANDEGGDKTEEATPKKLDDARKEPGDGNSRNTYGTVWQS